jgi:periplasmic divalent cation tolerance protein
MAAEITFVTCGSAEEAEKIAESLVRDGLAACVNLVPGVTSVYTWDGKLCRESEVLLVIKSTVAARHRMADRVRALHSYSVPEIVTFPIASGNPAYLKWVEDSAR